MVNTSGISFGGLGSGLDTGAIINQLMALERLPIRQIENDRRQVQNKIDRIGQFQNLVEALGEKAEELSSLEGFLALSVNGVDETIAKVSAGGAAIQGTHEMEVLRLASVDRWAFDSVLDPSVDLGTVNGQSVSFTVGTTNYDIAVDAEESSLTEIAAAINRAAGEEVNASVVNTGTSSNPSFQLVMASKASGEDGRVFNLSSSIDGLVIDSSPPDANGNPTSANNVTVGNNAQAEIDGLLIERSTNDFGDVLEGVSVEAIGLGSTSFGVEPDKEQLKAQVEEFISAYNDVITFMNTENTFTPAEEEGDQSSTGVLFGDSSIGAVKRELQSSLFDVPLGNLQGVGAGFATLSVIGISKGRDGLLSLDETKFDEKIAEDLSLLADLFTDSDGFERDPNAVENTPAYYEDTTADSGLFSNLARNLERLSGRIPNGESEIELRGIFDMRKETLQDSVKRMDSSIENKERALEAYRQDLVLRYARLEELMGGLNAQGAALQSAFFTR